VGGGGNLLKSLNRCLQNKKLTSEPGLNIFRHKCETRFIGPIISVLVIEAHVAKGESFLEQYQKRNPEKKKNSYK
jgi:hypothetical protein